MHVPANDAASRRRLLRRTASILVLSFLGLGLTFFLPAGTLKFWQAWLFLAVILGPMMTVMFYLIKHDTKLLERRLQAREKEHTQQIVQKLGAPFFTALWLVP